MAKDAEKAAVKAAKDAEKAAQKDGPCEFADKGGNPKVCPRGIFRSESCGVCGKQECKPLYYQPAK